MPRYHELFRSLGAGSGGCNLGTRSLFWRRMARVVIVRHCLSGNFWSGGAVARQRRARLLRSGGSRPEALTLLIRQELASTEFVGNDGEFDLALLDVKNRVRDPQQRGRSMNA
jgi:hypothetical protein